METFELIGATLQIILYVFAEFWWIIVPVALGFIFFANFETYNRINYLASLDWVLLELRVPREPNKSPKAMEQVFAGLHGVSGAVKTKDRIFKGKVGDWFSFEIAGTAGDIHFYVRTLRQYRNLVESQIYAQYPDVEIKEAEDYMNVLPPFLPNDDYDLFGGEFILSQPDPYPIRTYPEFEEKASGPDAAKRIDPLASVAEVLSTLEAGEYIGIQWLIRSPSSAASKAWMGRGQEVINKILGKGSKAKPSMAQSVYKEIDSWIFAPLAGPMSGAEKKEDKPADLTPGKREMIESIEKVFNKLPFETGLRLLYVGPTSNFHRAHVAALSGAFKQFASPAMNSLKPNDDTLPPQKGLFKKSKTFFRKSQAYKAYRARSFVRKPFIFNTEALATVYHFPDVTVKSPMLPRVETRKGEPPSGLPIG